MGAGNDTVTAGTGADSITITAGGTDKIVVANGDSKAPTLITLADTTTFLFAAADTITFGNGVDVVTGFTAGATGDTLDVTTAGAAITGIGVDAAALTATSELFFSGAWDSSTKVFTIAADGAGADTLLVDTVDTVASTADTWVVLVGVDSDNLHATATFV